MFRLVAICRGQVRNKRPFATDNTYGTCACGSILILIIMGINTSSLCIFLHLLTEFVLPNATYVTCCTGNLKHPLSNPDRVLSGSSGYVLNIALASQFIIHR
uniref:Uncharacterized protein n=1 Tax=Arundo donax TaxID=35708 RepID=A0A0A9DPI4_ARUDO